MSNYRYQKMDNRQFNEIVNAEDKLLTHISLQVQDLKHHSILIGETIDKSNDKIDNINIAVDNNIIRVNKTTNRINTLINKISGNKFIILVIIMILIIIILFFVLIK